MFEKMSFVWGYLEMWPTLATNLAIGYVYCFGIFFCISLNYNIHVCIIKNSSANILEENTHMNRTWTSLSFLFIIHFLSFPFFSSFLSLLLSLVFFCFYFPKKPIPLRNDRLINIAIHCTLLTRTVIDDCLF